MQSVLRRGPSGFVTLGYHGQRLAYLQLDREELPAPRTQDIHSFTGPSRTQIIGYTPGQLVLKFYELWNEPVWADLVIAYGGPTRSLLEALQRALTTGDLRLHKLLKGPNGTMQSWEYQLGGCTLEGLANDPEQVTVQGLGTIAKTLRLTPCPPSTMTVTSITAQGNVTTTGGFIPPITPTLVGATVHRATPTPTPTPAGDQELPEIQVARYALRSFNLDRGTLGSLYKSTTWNGGGATAECKHHPPCVNPPSPDPHRCGLYGTLTLDQLAYEYAQYAPRCVAVFAAEGRTMLGTKGLRTAAARIVAFWCATNIQKAVFDTHAPAAQHFERIEDLLAAYHFPAWHQDPKKFPPYQVLPALAVRQAAGAAQAVAPPVTPAPLGMAAGRRTGKIHATAVAATQAQLAGLLGAATVDAATPGGRAALAALLGTDVTVVPGTSGVSVGPMTLRCGKCTEQLSACSCPPRPSVSG